MLGTTLYGYNLLNVLGILHNIVNHCNGFGTVSNMHCPILPPEVSLTPSGQSSPWPDVQTSWQTPESERAWVASTGVEEWRQEWDIWRPSRVQLLQGYQCPINFKTFLVSTSENCSELFVLFNHVFATCSHTLLLFVGGVYLYYADHHLEEAIHANQEGGGLVLRGRDEKWLGMVHVATLSKSMMSGQLLEWMFPYLFQF